MTPDMWLDLKPIPHRASCILPHIAKLPQRGVALQLFGLAYVCHLPSCGLSAMGRTGGALKMFEPSAWRKVGPARS